TSSSFFNESGLDITESRSGGYGSAKDMTTLLTYTLREHPELFSATRYDQLVFTSLDNIDHRARNTNTDINAIPGLLVSKTGFADIAGGNLAIVFDAGLGRPIAIVVLGSTYEGRFSDVLTLTN